MAEPDGFEKICAALEWIAIFFAWVGLAVATAGTTALFWPWTEAAGARFFSDVTLGEFERPVAATLGIVGGSIVGKWLAAWWLVRHGLRREEAWAEAALWVGLWTWFALDSAISMWHDADFNVLLINTVPLLLFGFFLRRVRGRTHGSAFPVAARSVPGQRLLMWVCWSFVAVGLVVALGMNTPLFEVYRGYFGTVYFDGALPRPMRVYLAFIAGPIGATFLAHFAMLALALRAVGARRWVLRAVGFSVGGWFVVDTAMSLVHGAWFNVAMVNVPTLVVLAYPFGKAWKSQT